MLGPPVGRERTYFCLHVALAYVGGGGGSAGFVEVLFDDFFEGALGGEDEVDGVAAGSEAAGVGGHVVGGGFDLFAGVGGGDGETALTHDGEIDDVVADITELVDGVAGFGEDLVDGVHLVSLALVNELELKVVGADGYGLGVALGDDADAETAETAEGDAEAVVGGEALGLDAVTLCVGDDEDLAVGEDAVHVEDEDFYVLSAGFSGHELMIPWRTGWSIRQGV